MPENVKQLKIDDNTMTLTWDKNKLNESYKIVYKDKNGIERVIYPKTNAVTLKDLLPDQNYEYSIVALGNNTESDAANGGFMSGLCHGLIVGDANRVIEGTRINLSVLDDCVSDISWNNGSTAPTISDVPRETTTYVVSCTIKKGVTTKTCTDEFTITVDKKCENIVAKALASEVEQGDPIILRVKGCESDIKWEDGYLTNKIVGNTQTITLFPLESKLYTVSCKDADGNTCYAQTEAKVKCNLQVAVQYDQPFTKFIWADFSDKSGSLYQTAGNAIIRGIGELIVNIGFAPLNSVIWAVNGGSQVKKHATIYAVGCPNPVIWTYDGGKLEEKGDNYIYLTNVNKDIKLTAKCKNGSITCEKEIDISKPKGKCKDLKIDVSKPTNNQITFTVNSDTKVTWNDNNSNDKDDNELSKISDTYIRNVL
jgi:hypothetical protein